MYDIYRDFHLISVHCVMMISYGVESSSFNLVLNQFNHGIYGTCSNGGKLICSLRSKQPKLRTSEPHYSHTITLQ